MRVLYVEDDERDAELARRQIRRLAPHITIECVGSLREARERIESPDAPAYDLILADLRLPDGQGLELLQRVRELALPMAVVIITGLGDEETAVGALKAGADDYVVKSKDYLSRLPIVLEAALHRHRVEGLRRARPLRVLYAEHNPTDADLTRRHLARFAPYIHLEVVHDAPQALARLPGPQAARDYDVLLFDYRLPGLNALEALKELTVRRVLLPVVIVTGQGDEEVALQAIRLGAADYVVKSTGYLYHLPSVLENAFHHAALIREQAALRESEARFRRLAENAQDLIYRYRLTPPVGFEYVSPAATAITGYTPEEHYADPELGRKIVHPDDRPLLERVAADPVAGRAVTLRWVRKDGRIIWTEQRNVPIFDETGALIAIEGIARDVTDRKRMEEDLRRAIQAKEEMIQNVSHELRTPLALVMGYLELLQSETLGPANDAQRRALNVALTQAERLRFMVNRLILLQTFDPRLLHRVELDPEAWLRSQIPPWQERAAQAGLALRLELQHPLPAIQADPEMLQHVLDNLLDNALKFGAGGGEVKIQAWAEPTALRWTVTDYGAGIPADKLAQLGERFFQADASSTRRFGGMGIGLALCRVILEAHQGRLWAESAGPGCGAAFHVSLPLTIQDDPQETNRPCASTS